MDSKSTPITLHIPHATRSRLSFCDAGVTKFSRWVKNLLIANTGEASRQLYQAIRELNTLNCPSAKRFELLELIRPQIYSVCEMLNKHFLHSSISLNEKQLKIANLSQALQGHLATGYKMVVAHSLDQLGEGAKPPRHLATAMHRAISDSGQTILRAYQLYFQPPEHTWLDLNHIYLMAEARQLDHVRIDDLQARHIGKSSIRSTFKRVHLLGCVKPNNLRQQDLGLLYDACEYWAPLADLTDADDEDALFIINLQRDRPGQYRQHFRDQQTQNYRSLNTQKLVAELMKRSTGVSDTSIEVPTEINEALLTHVIQSWGIHWQRSFRRITAEGQVGVCVGLSALHYYTAGQRDFDQIMLRMNSIDRPNKVISAKTEVNTSEDIWADAFDAGGLRIPNNESINLDVIEFINRHQTEDGTSETKTHYSNYLVRVINTSPGGYCLQWQNDLPGNIQAGELVGIRGTGVQHWAIGTIRWIRHVRGHGTQLGIELIAPRAEVGIVRLLQKTGSNGPQMRALVLPAIKAIAQPASVILPRIPFRTGNKIELVHEKLNGRYQLSKCVTSTTSFGQFQFRSMNATPTQKSHIVSAVDDRLIEDDFDSLWNKL